ncbi:MAG: hypothetical protein ACTSQY_08740 [Candidatus Odinarchaeia archaeon]
MKKKFLKLFMIFLILIMISGCAQHQQKSNKITYRVIYIPAGSIIILPDQSTKRIPLDGYWFSNGDVIKILNKLNEQKGGKKSNISIDVTFN